MTLPTGNQRVRAGREVRLRGFTLIELILVMALLVIVLSLAAPSLARFFRGRNLELEARRFLSLTRYAQNLAVTEGMPYLLWIDTEKRAYGLIPETRFDEFELAAEQERDPLTYELARDLQLEVELLVPGLAQPATNTLLSARGTLDTPWKQSALLVGNLPTIRLTPDGFIHETSPQAVGFREGEEKPTAQDPILWVGQSRTRLNYEIWTNPPSSLRR